MTISRTTKAMSIRLNEELAADAEAVARVEGVSVNALVNEALAEHIAAKRKDKKFQAALAQVLEADRTILERLAGQ
jgi:predicted transcriptional regulator